VSPLLIEGDIFSIILLEKCQKIGDWRDSGMILSLAIVEDMGNLVAKGYSLCFRKLERVPNHSCGHFSISGGRIL
jgi:hypothetical protein